MPKGNPNTQTRATDKYQKKAGIISKSFKLKKELTDRFQEVCAKTGRSQASAITELMEKFISDNQ